MAGRVKKSGSMGNSVVHFDLDDADKKLANIELVNNEPTVMVLELLDANDAVLNTYEVAPGQSLNLPLTEREKVPYVEVEVTKNDGSKKISTQFPYRLYFR